MQKFIYEKSYSQGCWCQISDTEEKLKIKSNFLDQLD